MGRVLLNPEREAQAIVAFNAAYDVHCKLDDDGFEAYKQRLAEFVDLYQRLKAEQLAETGYLRLHR